MTAARYSRSRMAVTVNLIEFESLTGPHRVTFTPGVDKPTNIGRSAASEVCLPHEGISRKHAMIVMRAGEWFVVDHASRVGSYLNGVKLEPAKPAALAPGDLLRIGPWTFRARAAGSMQARTATLDDTMARAQRVETAVPVNARADQRLRLLGECMAKLAGATEEKALARAALESALAGSGFARGAILRSMGASEEIQLVESVRRDPSDAGEFAFSRSLVRRAAAGETVMLATDATAASQVQHSIAELRIHSAMCAPVFLGGSVEGYLYLDARGKEQLVQQEAGGFCDAVARAYGLAMANLKRIELLARQQTMERDLDAARQAQQVMLPPTQGTIGGIHYAMRMRPGLFVAGDMFDVVELPGDRVALCVGDVSGHGLGSAMLMALAQSQLHAQLLNKPDAGAAVTAVNRFVAKRAVAGRFASLFVGIVSREDSSWRVDFVDAGHGYWLVRDREGARSVTSAGGIPIGIDPEGVYQTETVRLDPSSRLVLYTDGIVEQRNAAGVQFGRPALMSAFPGTGTATEDVEAVFNAIDAYSGGGGLDDDATVASVELAG